MQEIVNLIICRRRAFVFLRPFMLRRHLLFYTPHAGGALFFLCDRERKQRSRRECDSPLPTPVGTENRTFPGLQPLSVLRYKVKRRKYFLILWLFFIRVGRPGDRTERARGTGLPRGRRPARPLTRKLVFIHTILCKVLPMSARSHPGARLQYSRSSFGPHWLRAGQTYPQAVG